MGKEEVNIMFTKTAALVIMGLCLSWGCASCGNKTELTSAEGSNLAPAEPPKADTKSTESQAVEPQVESEVGKLDAEKRAKLMGDAVAALDETRKRDRGAG